MIGMNNGFARMDIYFAIINGNVDKLRELKKQGVDFNYYDTSDETYLQLAIRYNKSNAFDALIECGININTASRADGTTALHEAVRLGSVNFTNKLIDLGANVNARSHDGFTPLNDALAFKKYNLAEILLKVPQVDVNIPGEQGTLPILYPFIDGKFDILNKILNHSSYDATFNSIMVSGFNLPKLEEYLMIHGKPGDINLINAYEESKLFGLKFDLDGCMPLNTLSTHEYGCLTFDGYFNAMGIIAINDSYNQFYSNVISQSTIPTWASQAFVNVKESLHFSASVFDPAAYYDKHKRGDAVIIPSGWDDHSIAFVIHKDTLYRCNRGDESDSIHGIEEFKITKPENINVTLIDFMIGAEGESHYLQHELINILGLQKIGMVENPTQIAGNCVWTSLETAVEAAFISNFLDLGIDSNTAHQVAKSTFLVWEEYDLTTTLKRIIDHKDTFIAAEVYDDLLIRSFEMHHDPFNVNDVQRGIFALNELDNKDFFKQFDQEIGRLVHKFDPQQADKISYMNAYSSTYYDYVMSWTDIFNYRMTKEDKQQAKEYLDFLKACDDYQKEMPLSTINFNEVITNGFVNTVESLFEPNIPYNVIPTPMAMMSNMLQALVPESIEHYI